MCGGKNVPIQPWEYGVRPHGLISLRFCSADSWNLWFLHDLRLVPGEKLLSENQGTYPLPHTDSCTAQSTQLITTLGNHTNNVFYSSVEVKNAVKDTDRGNLVCTLVGHNFDNTVVDVVEF